MTNREQERLASYALDRATALLSFYGRDNIDDPDTFLVVMTAILSRYPQEVIDAVTDPATGIHTTIKWTPKPAEVREACDQAYAPIQRRAEREEQTQRQLAERAEYENVRRRAPTVDELKAYYGPKWGLNTDREAESAEAKARRTAELDKANKRVFELECERAGVSATSAISPSLARLMRDKDIPTHQDTGE